MTQDHHAANVLLWLCGVIVFTNAVCGIWWLIRTACGGNVRWWEFGLIALFVLPGAWGAYPRRGFRRYY
jgi:hypothetical protein